MMKMPDGSSFYEATIRQEAGATDLVGLSSLERRVVDLARRDSLASLRQAGRFGKATRLLLGRTPSPKLADPRLETLRRFAVLVRRAPETIDAEEISRMRAAGFSQVQMSEVVSLLGRAARPHARRRAAGILAVLTITLAAGVFRWMSEMLGDPVIAAILVATILLPLLPLLWPERSR